MQRDRTRSQRERREPTIAEEARASSPPSHAPPARSARARPRGPTPRRRERPATVRGVPGVVPPSCSSSTAATVSTMPRNGSRPAWNAGHALLVGGVVDAPARCRPRCPAVSRQPRPPGSASSSSGRNSHVLRRCPVARRRPRRAPGRASRGRARSAAACPAGWPGPASTRRRTRPSSGRPTAGGRRRRCVVRHVEEQVRLDHLEALVDQRGRVDRDDRAHVPGGVGQRLLRRDVVELSRARPAERPAARGEHQPPHLVGPTAAQALGERRVLGVDRHDLPGRRPPPVTSGPPAISDSLLASASVRPARSAASVGARPIEPVMRVEHDVARPRGELGDRVGPGQDLGHRVVARRIAAPLSLGVEGQLQVLRGAGPGDSDDLDAQLERLPASSSTLPPPAPRPTTRNRSGLRRTTSMAWVPTEPVDPSTTTSRRLLTRPLSPTPCRPRSVTRT